ESKINCSSVSWHVNSVNGNVYAKGVPNGYNPLDWQAAAVKCHESFLKWSATNPFGDRNVSIPNELYDRIAERQDQEAKAAKTAEEKARVEKWAQERHQRIADRLKTDGWEADARSKNENVDIRCIYAGFVVEKNPTSQKGKRQ